MWGWRKCEVHGFSFEVKSEKKKIATECGLNGLICGANGLITYGALAAPRLVGWLVSSGQYCIF